MIKGTNVPFKEVGKSGINFYFTSFPLNKKHVATDFGNFIEFDLATFGLTAGTMYQKLLLLFLKRQILLDSQSNVHETYTCMQVRMKKYTKFFHFKKSWWLKYLTVYSYIICYTHHCGYRGVVRTVYNGSENLRTQARNVTGAHNCNLTDRNGVLIKKISCACLCLQRTGNKHVGNAIDRSSTPANRKFLLCINYIKTTGQQYKPLTQKIDYNNLKLHSMPVPETITVPQTDSYKMSNIFIIRHTAVSIRHICEELTLKTQHEFGVRNAS
jgi:hypothetical protein